MALQDYWEDVESSLYGAKGIAFDTCHKIYVLLDDEQVALMREYEYDLIFTSEEMNPEQMLDTLKEWYEKSCALKFIQAVETNHDDPNAGFTTLIEQGAEQEEEECDLCFSRCGNTCDDYDEEDEDEEDEE